jgi:uncharacterized membrane protein
MNVNRRMVSAALATTAAALFATGAVVGTAGAADDVKIKCYGANACKGHSECKTAMSSCKGKNACKGKGFEMMSEKACIEKVGRG